MLVHLLVPLTDYFPVFNVFRYITFRTAWATIFAFLISLWIGPWLIRWLKNRQVGQYIRSDGPSSHHSKKGTPTMGGVIIVAAVVGAALLFCRLDNVYVWLVIWIALTFGLIGFLDDYLKVVLKNSKGLSARQKMAGLIASSVVFAWCLGMAHAWGYDTRGDLYVPFFKSVVIPLGAAYGVLVVLVLVGSANSVNLTDGLDGLAIGVVMMVALVYLIIAYVSGHIGFAHYLQIKPIAGAGELAVIAGAMVGSGLGFLWFNAHPAQVFMGDVGALSLGGTLGAIAVITGQELLLVIAGGVCVLEAVSVMLQVGSYKLSKRRIFRMAPLHHHFELSGIPETKVVIRLWILSAIFALVALSALKLR